MKTRPIITAESIIEEIGEAIRQVGAYTFWDKCVYEFVDLDAVASALKRLTAQEASGVIRAVSKSNVHGEGTGERTASAIVVCLEEWDALFDEPDMENLL